MAMAVMELMGMPKTLGKLAQLPATTAKARMETTRTLNLQARLPHLLTASLPSNQPAVFLPTIQARRVALVTVRRPLVPRKSLPHPRTLAQPVNYDLLRSRRHILVVQLLSSPNWLEASRFQRLWLLSLWIYQQLARVHSQASHPHSQPRVLSSNRLAKLLAQPASLRPRPARIQRLAPAPRISVKNLTTQLLMLSLVLAQRCSERTRAKLMSKLSQLRDQFGDDTLHELLYSTVQQDPVLQWLAGPLNVSSSRSICIDHLLHSVIQQ